MSLRERVYSVLIVSAAKNFNLALFNLLPESKYAPVTVVSGMPKELLPSGIMIL